MSTIKTSNTNTVATLRSELEALGDFADYLMNTTSFLDDVTVLPLLINSMMNCTKLDGIR